MSDGATFFTLLKERLPASFVQGWDGRDGEELFRAVARVFETMSARAVDEIRGARILLASFAAKATGTVTITWAAETVEDYELSAGQVIVQTEWGLRFRALEPVTRAAADPAGSATIDVEAEWSGWEGNIDAGLVDRWAVPTTGGYPDEGGRFGPVDLAAWGLTWGASTTNGGQVEFLTGVVDGTITVSASSAMTGGAGGSLDLLARGAGLPIEVGETAAQVRRKLRAAPQIVTPTDMREAVVAMLGTDAVYVVEPWDDGAGFAWGVSGWGHAAWMPSVWRAIVLVPVGTDTTVVQTFVNRIRAWGYRVDVLEGAP